MHVYMASMGCLWRLRKPTNTGMGVPEMHDLRAALCAYKPGPMCQFAIPDFVQIQNWLAAKVQNSYEIL